ncbi:MAG: c-type heme family protein [Geminicoccaceae bacterium]
MGLRFRFNLILTVVLLPGFIVSAGLSYVMLQRNTQDEVAHTANLMIEAAHAVRSYTSQELQPLLAGQLSDHFVQQSVPAYAASQVLGKLSDTYRDFGYKEATLNPTNPRNRALDWEADLVETFRKLPMDKKILTGVRSTPSGPSMYIASPIQVQHASCLECHGTSAMAPPSLVEQYGSANGFGWQLSEVVGAQIVSIPTSVPKARAWRAFLVFVSSLCVIFAVVYIVLNRLLTRLIIRPISNMAVTADKLSTGDFDVGVFDEKRDDEIGGLAISFNRMRLSMIEALKMIKETDAR